MKNLKQNINNITDKIMFKVADALAFKITFLIFCIIAIVPLFFQIPQDILSWQSYLSQTVIQLISLSILAVVSKKEGAKTERILMETHDTVMSELEIMKQDAIYDKEEREELRMIIHELSEHFHRQEGEI